jgi:putative transposase
MPRGPRLDYPGALHHLIARGIERRTIFCTERDRLRWLGSYATTFNRIHRRCGHLFQNRFKSTLVEEEPSPSRATRRAAASAMRARAACWFGDQRDASSLARTVEVSVSVSVIL